MPSSRRGSFVGVPSASGGVGQRPSLANAFHFHSSSHHTPAGGRRQSIMNGLHLQNLPRPHIPIKQIKDQLHEVEVFANGVSYLMYITLPVHVAMIVLGMLWGKIVNNKKTKKALKMTNFMPA